MDWTAQALSLWGLAEAPCRFVAGRENRVYRVSTPEGDFALRVRRPGYRTEAELLSELQWLAAMDAAGLSVPRPRPTTTGVGLVLVQDHHVDLVSWLDGQPMGQTGTPLQLEDAPLTFHRLGETMARLHGACDAWARPAAFTRCDWGLDGLVGERPLWGRFWDNPMLDDATRRLLVAFRHRAGEVLAQQTDLDVGLIHADLVRENVLCDGAQIRLIDFDDGGFGHRLFDIATALIKNRAEPDYSQWRHALIDGYQGVRPIDTQWLDLFMALRAVTYVGWIVPRLGEAGAPQRLQRFVHDAQALCSAWLDTV